MFLFTEINPLTYLEKHNFAVVTGIAVSQCSSSEWIQLSCIPSQQPSAMAEHRRSYFFFFYCYFLRLRLPLSSFTLPCSLLSRSTSPGAVPRRRPAQAQQGCAVGCHGRSAGTPGQAASGAPAAPLAVAGEARLAAPVPQPRRAALLRTSLRHEPVSSKRRVPNAPAPPCP